MIAGIDIGTSYSSICVLDGNGKIQPVETATGVSMYGSKYSLPSAVFAEDDGTVLVGQAAMNSRPNKPGQFCMEFKRNLGQDVPIFLGNYRFLPEDLYREIFIHMKNCVKKAYGEDITQAYVTCPASFGRKKREKVMAAAKAAGLFQVSLVDEPTAAARSYLSQGMLKDGQKILLYDFGGGTFDVSLLSYEKGDFRLLAEPGGIEQCGGIDMDRCIFQDILSHIDKEALEQLQKNPMNKMRFESQTGEQAVKIKHQLSSTENCREYILMGWESIPYEISAVHFNEMIAPLVGQTIDACRRILKSADLSVKDLSAVFMVGGTSRVALVREMVQRFAGDVPVYSSVDLELAVAMGAVMGGGSREEEDEGERNEGEQWFQLGNKYYNGDGVEEDDEKAVRCYEKAAELGNAAAQFKLGTYYEVGLVVRQDYEEAVKWYKKAAEQGEAVAQIYLGDCYEDGRGVPQNSEEAVKWYRKAAEQGEAAAQNNLGFCYEDGRGVPQNSEEAVKWYRKAAEQGNVTAQRNLGDCYENGRGVPQNYREAVKWYKKAAEQGEAVAQIYLGDCYENGRGAPQNYKEAVKWYREAAKQGNAIAQKALGECYYYGQGVHQDYKEAVKWYRKAAEQGEAAAQNNLGLCYENGCGVPQNYKEAVKWYRKAAEQGYAIAQNNLGNCYYDGQGVLQDCREAVKWYRRAAERGNTAAQTSLGVCYEDGRGVPRDYEEAARWYEMAGEAEKRALVLKKIRR